LNYLFSFEVMEYSWPIESSIEIEPYEEIVGRLDYSTLRASRSGSPVCDIEEEQLDPPTLCVCSLLLRGPTDKCELYSRQSGAATSK